MSHSLQRAAGWLLAGLGLGCGLSVGAAPLALEGELYARDSIALMPPSIDGLWQLNISLLAPDGAAVKAGEPVLGFDATQLQNNLREKQSQLDEKMSQQHKLRLELAERERNETVALEQARAELEKAQRKASQPAELLASIEYRKLSVDKQLAEQAFALAERKHRLAAEQRRQEQRALQAEIAQLSAEVKRIETGIGQMTQVAPRDGLLQHKSGWDGNKFEVGSQVWRGLAVAELPDPASMAVRAHLPETDYLKLRAGDVVDVRVEGSGLTLPARVEAIGRAVISKSRLQPVPVIEVTVSFEPEALASHSKKLKPGQAVRVLRADRQGESVNDE
ncbi:HlyD family secretion protein [Pseudomarimonas arenosa]|uniref:HlyD family efflux transporter periplasmic adaptor subunit n=1 Tax=Pseudomarimonas arenosa TaxID=2774145 RepID=A0AAW3ZIY4_9GAMM|nr:HlyD family efflux transporter periplasmic adaptor subunit [Pseudomarimonas arenosa]MBD8525743.1 HlyD family efflux transporter periplasmic adaptor subunit [Pseudomarimonas arenosa]